jgi:hypothetical protein
MAARKDELSSAQMRRILDTLLASEEPGVAAAAQRAMFRIRLEDDKARLKKPPREQLIETLTYVAADYEAGATDLECATEYAQDLIASYIPEPRVSNELLAACIEAFARGPTKGRPPKGEAAGKAKSFAAIHRALGLGVITEATAQKRIEKVNQPWAREHTLETWARVGITPRKRESKRH